LRHLDRAHAVRDIDPEFAVFHAITAEEEAATAVFHALRRRKYDGADKLNGRNHLHKAALLPFLRSVGHFLFSAAKEIRHNVQIEFSERDIERPVVVKLHRPGADTEFVLPRPFEFQTRIVGNGNAPDFSAELEEVASVAKAKSIEDHIRTRANERNRVLYAAPDGMPSVKTGERYLAIAAERVLTILLVFLMVDQHEQQPFAQDAVRAFLTLLTRIDRRLAKQFA
jgi:hypothetical protein